MVFQAREESAGFLLTPCAAPPITLYSAWETNPGKKKKNRMHKASRCPAASI